MKRIHFLVTVLLVATTMVANITIQTEFDGIVLGQSSREEVRNILTSKGLEYSSEESTIDDFGYSDVYEGVYSHEEMNFDMVVTRFVGDTLVTLSFNGFCDSVCNEYAKFFIDKIHSKYNHLTIADSSLLVISAMIDLEGFRSWSRRDGESVILTLQNDTSCTCVYFAENKLLAISLNKALELLMMSSPDYADENKVYGVAGVKFGDYRENVKRVILSKSEKISEEDSHSVTFNNAKIGGTTYDFATFYFAANKGLLSVNLQRYFNSWRKEEALMAFEGVQSQYGRKYSNLQMLKDKEDLKVYSCGSYIDGYDYLPIIISFQKALSVGGDIMYYVQVDYYLHRRDGLYDDEI